MTQLPALERAHPHDLQRYDRNARTHSKKQIAQIARSIEEFGWTNPILVDDERRIIAGHGRVEAAKLLGLETVPILRLSHLTEAQKRAYVLADNRLAELAGWDKAMLAQRHRGMALDQPYRRRPVDARPQYPTNQSRAVQEHHL